jgi:putative phosphoesterase
MKIGIISDTHDDLDNTARAISIFNKEGTSLIIHAGDYIFPGIVEKFKDMHSSARLVGILGNNDGEKFGLLKKFEEIRGELKKSEFAEVTEDELKIGIYHGTDPCIRESVIKSENYDIFVHGHTHIKRFVQKGRTLVLNPGTAHDDFPTIEQGRIEHQPTVIIFDTADKSVSFYSLSDGKKVSLDHLVGLQTE